MLRFLFGTKPTAAAKPETQREAFARLLADLNAALAELPEKPKVTIDPATGGIELHLPEQLPDEALALPAPEEAAQVKSEDTNAEASSDPSADAETSDNSEKPKAA